MATFLQLVNDLERESGTVDRLARTADVTAPPTSRQEKMVAWVREAWVIIQNARSDWRFMRGEFESVLVAGRPRYSSNDLDMGGEPSWPQDNSKSEPLAVFDPAIGRADLSYMRYVPWTDWKARWHAQPQPAGRPAEWSIDFDSNLCVGPTPDKNYVIAGDYVRGAQVLMNNDDVPRCPARYHSTIVWRALMLLGNHDEANATIVTANGSYMPAFAALVNGTTESVEF